MARRREAHEDGAWVREAALAHAAKHRFASAVVAKAGDPGEIATTANANGGGDA
jgi:hypothetical protein